MKKINYIFAIAVITLLNSCSADFLEREPALKMSEKDIFSTHDRIEGSLLGIYAQIKNTSEDSYLGGKSYVAIDAKGEDFENISNNLVTLFGTYNMQTGENDQENIINWQEAYLTINNTNIFLSNIEKAKSVAGDSYEQFRAEALFLRGLSYYYLNMFYGKPYKINPNAKSVPLRLTPSIDGSGNNMKRSTVKEIFDQILSDLNNETISALKTETNSYDGTTRASQGAAHALKMRIYMAMENWDAAISEGNSISGYSLETSISSVFSSDFTNENIFSLPMADNNRPNTQQSVWEYYHDGQIMVIDETNGIYSKSGYNNPLDSRIANLIMDKNGKKICTKFTSKNSWIPIFRYAEIKLNLAECYAQKGDATSEANAQALLKEVRRRSLSSSNDTDLTDSQIGALTGDALKTAIYNERRLELLGEGIRSLDIHRRAENYIKGSLTVTPNDNNYIWPIPSSETSINKDL